MRKQDFLNDLRKGLSGLPESDREEWLTFYREMIDDRIEEGLSEEDAIADIGAVDDLSAQIIADTPLTKLVKERFTTKPKKSAWEIVFLILGFPIWGGILIAASAVLIALYITLWAAVAAFGAILCSLFVCGFGGIVAGTVFVCRGHITTGIAVFGAGMVCAGLSILSFFGFKPMIKSAGKLTKQFVIWLKHLMMKKEDA